MRDLIKIFDDYRGRYGCYDCGTMKDTRHSYSKKYICRGCTDAYNGENESVYIVELRKLFSDFYVLQQYTDENLVNEKGNKLIFDIALFRNSTDDLPIFVFEVLSYNNLCNSNQDGLRDNYIKKVLFARDVLKVPMIEFRKSKNPIEEINKAKLKYENLLTKENSTQYIEELNKSFYESIMKRLGIYPR